MVRREHKSTSLAVFNAAAETKMVHMQEGVPWLPVLTLTEVSWA